MTAAISAALPALAEAARCVALTLRRFFFHGPLAASARADPSVASAGRPSETGWMSAAATGWLVLAVALLTGSGYAVVVAYRLYDRTSAGRPEGETPEPIELLNARLRRLHELLDATETAPSDTPAKNLRCRATRAAYVDALSAACLRFRIAPPAGRPVPAREIFRVESDLRRRGVDVRRAG